MTTAEIIKQMEKEFDERFPNVFEGRLANGSAITKTINLSEVKSFMKESTRTLLEIFGEEIIGDCDDLFLEWRAYVNKAYEEKKPQAIFGFPVWLEKKQRLKKKEIINSISK